MGLRVEGYHWIAEAIMALQKALEVYVAGIFEDPTSVQHMLSMSQQCLKTSSWQDESGERA